LDDDLSPTSGLLFYGTIDFADAGGTAKYVRLSPDISYYIPLEHVFGSKAWVLKFGATGGDLIPILGYQENIVDRFFLGGDSLRGFADGGVGPHDADTQDSVGGRIMWTQTTELHFPLPVSPDLGISGFAFVDVGSLYGARTLIDPATHKPYVDPSNGVSETLDDSTSPRVGAGIGVSWNTPFGLINLSLAEPIVKQHADQIQQFRVSFGTRF